MPKLKQIDSLQKIALDYTFNSVFNYCARVSAQGSIDELRRAISDIKQHVYIFIPWHLLSDFVKRFLDEFYTLSHPVRHIRAALEIMMDAKIPGLRCKHRMLTYVDPGDVHRIDGLTELGLRAAHYVPKILGNFRLHDLTEFHNFPGCTDAHLTVIGQNCSKLELLKIPYSTVTDEGLRSLSGCSELRVVDIVQCNKVTHIGLAHLLSKNRKLEELLYGHYIDRMKWWRDFGLHNLCGLHSHSKRTALKLLNINHGKITETLLVLNNILTMFPNLTHLDITCSTAFDLTKLKSLDCLTGLQVSFLDDMNHDECTSTWNSIKKFLTSFGANITTLKLGWKYQHLAGWQKRIDFIFENCPNLEYLGFDHESGLIDVPPFPKLKKLDPHICPTNNWRKEDYPRLKFRELPNLETLSLIQYAIDFNGVKSIILDHLTFPKLSLIEITRVPAREFHGLQQVVRDNNLDLKIKNRLTEINKYVYVSGALGYQFGVRKYYGSN